MLLLLFLFYLDNHGEWNLNVSTVQFVVRNKEIIQSEKHFEPWRIHKCILKYILNCRREVEVKPDGRLMVTVQRREGRGDAGNGDRRVVQLWNAEWY